MCGENKFEQRLHGVEQNIQEIFVNQKALIGIITNMQNKIQEMEMQLYIQKIELRNKEYELQDVRRPETDIFYPIIESAEKTIELIINEKKSLARFGDGEFSIMENIQRQGFQRVDSKLSERLKEVIVLEEASLLIGIADNYGNLDKYTDEGKNEIRAYMTDNVREVHKKYLKRDKIYYDAYITRPYLLYRDKSNMRSKFENIKRIWQERDIVLVEGAQTRVGIGNDLLNNAKSIKRIIGPATNSFDRYNDILEAALSIARKDTLFLVALGPSAGVVVYDLVKNGYQAVDIGHIDIEYEWFLSGRNERTLVKNKYVNEMSQGRYVSDEGLPQEYWEQIVADCS